MIERTLMYPVLHILLEQLASLKLTLFIIAAFAVGLLLSYLGFADGTWALAVPLALFAANLLAAVVVNPAFRRQRGLLIFHLGLIVIVLLVAAGRMTYMRGKVELTEGEEFDGQVTINQAGPWYRPALDQVHFTNGGFRIGYSPGLQRDKTRNLVVYLDAEGKPQQKEIGDQNALLLNGYRFYTTPNKGFAPAFLWQPAGADTPVLGSVHLPSYPANAARQALEWQLPGTDIRLWTMLQFDEVIIDPDRPSEFRLPNRHTVIVRIGEQRHELQPGQAIELPQGRLVYDGLRTWMGYSVFYDRTIHWLLIACMIAVMALGWHFWRKFAARPWDR